MDFLKVCFLVSHQAGVSFNNYRLGARHFLGINDQWGDSDAESQLSTINLPRKCSCTSYYNINMEKVTIAMDWDGGITGDIASVMLLWKMTEILFVLSVQ